MASVIGRGGEEGRRTVIEYSLHSWGDSDFVLRHDEVSDDVPGAE